METLRTENIRRIDIFVHSKTMPMARIVKNRVLFSKQSRAKDRPADIRLKSLLPDKGKNLKFLIFSFF